MRRFIALNDIHIRHKHPGHSALIKGIIFQGFDVVVEDEPVDGEDIEGNNKWFRNGDDFFWSGGLTHSSGTSAPEEAPISPRPEEVEDENIPPISERVFLDWRGSLSEARIPSTWLGEGGHGLDGEEVRIGLLDSGVSHSDLQAAINRGGEIDFTGRGTRDVHGHGTGVAGIIAAFSRGNKGIIGVAPKVNLFSAKVRGRSGIKVPDIIEAIKWCERQNVDIISMSFGNVRTDHERSDELVSLIEKLSDQGITFVIAAGDARNINQNGRDILIDRTNFPANIEACISVATVMPEWWRAFTSTPDIRVAPSVDFIAPFRKIWTTSIASDNNPREQSGSSFAVPFVTGLVAIIINVFELRGDELRQHRVQEIKNRLREIAIPLQEMSFDAAHYQPLVKTQVD